MNELINHFFNGFSPYVLFRLNNKSFVKIQIVSHYLAPREPHLKRSAASNLAVSYLLSQSCSIIRADSSIIACAFHESGNIAAFACDRASFITIKICSLPSLGLFVADVDQPERDYAIITSLLTKLKCKFEAHTSKATLQRQCVYSASPALSWENCLSKMRCSVRTRGLTMYVEGG